MSSRKTNCKAQCNAFDLDLHDKVQSLHLTLQCCIQIFSQPQQNNHGLDKKTLEWTGFACYNNAAYRESSVSSVTVGPRDMFCYTARHESFSCRANMVHVAINHDEGSPK